MHSQVGRAIDSERASMHLPCSIVDIMSIISSMYQWVSLKTRTGATTSVGYLLLYLFFLFVTIVQFWCCAFTATVLCIVVPSVAPPHSIVVVALVRYTRPCVCTILYTLVPIVCNVLDRATSHYFLARQEHLAMDEWQNQHDGVKDYVWRFQ